MALIPKMAWHGVWVGFVAALGADVLLAVLKRLNINLPTFGGA